MFNLMSVAVAAEANTGPEYFGTFVTLVEQLPLIAGVLIAMAFFYSIKWALKWKEGKFWPVLSGVLFPISVGSLVTLSTHVVVLISKGDFGQTVIETVLIMVSVIIPIIYFDFMSHHENIKIGMRNFHDNITSNMNGFHDAVKNIVEDRASLKDVESVYDVFLRKIKGKTGGLKLSLFGGESGDKLNKDERINLLYIYGEKIEEACLQLEKREMYVRRIRFSKIWKNLVREPGYLSVCDLSPYSRLQLFVVDYSKFYATLQMHWKERILDEVTSLGTTKSLTKKIFVFSPYTTSLVVETGTNGVRYACNATNPKCDFKDCNNVRCIVKFVITTWLKSTEAYQPRAPVYLISKNTIYPIIERMNDQPQQRFRLSSIDFGVFGDKFVGEEFKIPIELDPSKSVTIDYLYRIKHDGPFAVHLKTELSRLLDGVQCVAS